VIGRRAYGGLIAALAMLVLALMALSLLIGPANISAAASLKALFVSDGATSLVMREIRLPRALLAAMIGGTLGLTGAALQGFLRNPLADAGVLGIGSSAALGAVIAIYTGLSAAFPLALPLCALAGATIAVLAVLALGAGANTTTLILAGIAVSSLAAALTSLALNLASSPFAALEIVFWLLGSLNDRSMLHVGLATPFMIAGWLMIGSLARALDALTLGHDTAASLGFRLSRVRLLLVLGTAASVGAATAVAGSIGFVGLVTPHLLRPFVGGMAGRLLLASWFGGAGLLLAADIVTRVISPEKDLKLGVVTALVGAPFFLALVLKSREAAP
jgi:iron complex transport system permease protein